MLINEMAGSITAERRHRRTDRAGLSQGDCVMKKVLLPLLCILLLAAAGVAQANKPLLMRDPTLSKTHIVFSYAGDLWVVSREGGDAARLTNGKSPAYEKTMCVLLNVGSRISSGLFA